MEPTPVQTYLLEAHDLLEQIEALALDALHAVPGPEAINSLFRAFHTIKGSGSMFGFSAVASFTHHVESTLDRVRAGSVLLTPALLQLVLQANDHIRLLLQAHEQGVPAPDGTDLIQSFEMLAPVPESNPEAAGKPVESMDTAIFAGKTATLHIRFRPHPSISANGLDPASLLADLRKLGTLTIRPLLDRLPTLAAIEPELCYLGWEMDLETAADLNAVRDVFIFAEDGAELEITRAEAQPPKDAASEPDAPLSTVAAPDGGVQGAGPLGNRARSRDGVVRVSSERLDRLVSLVGELVMNQSRLNQVATRIQQADLDAPVEAIERLISELRENVLGIRMTAFGTTLGRFRRLVHDLSRELGKQVDLVTTGEETELDKTVLDQLGDPLVHLVRNSLDHGLESAAERVQAGKPAQGRLELAATHQGANVIITIKDDGRGLDPDAIRARAIERGLIKPDTVLQESELFALIFLPGFSTAKTVTSVSGRGVGMDVVRRQIDSLRGTVHLSSTRGRGTTVTLTLPLTLAIIEGLLVEVGKDQFIIPMSAVTENVELSAADRRLHGGRQAIPVRGELVPFLRLRKIFEVTDAAPPFEKIVIVRHEDERIGLVVDRVIGTHQTVIQSLNRFCRGVKIVSGSTIMGDGRVALIIDIAGIVRTALQRPVTVGSAA